MKPFKRFLFMLLIGFMTFAEGMGWNAPSLESLTCKDKSTQIDKVQELNSLTFRSTKSSNDFQTVIRLINHENYSYSFTNVTFIFHDIFKASTVLLVSSGVISYLHLLQLY